jgi:putative transposase
VKYRHEVITGDVERSLRAILYRIAEDHNFRIVEYSANKDHLHLLLDCKPQHYIPDIIKAMKGVSGRLLMKEFGDELRSKLWGGHLWNPSYFVATVSENTEEQISVYIRNQK